MSSLDEKDIQEIYESALNDPSLFSDLNVEHLLDAIDEDKYENIENKTINSINEEIFDVVNCMNMKI